MAIIYDGVLSNRRVEYINHLLDTFSEVLEMRSLPPDWTAWSNANLADYTSPAEDCQGNPYQHTYKSYGFVRRNDPDEPLFLFFRSQREKQLVVDAFPDLVLNKSPFKTIIKP